MTCLSQSSSMYASPPVCEKAPGGPLLADQHACVLIGLSNIGPIRKRLSISHICSVEDAWVSSIPQHTPPSRISGAETKKKLCLAIVLAIWKSISSFAKSPPWPQIARRS